MNCSEKKAYYLRTDLNIKTKIEKFLPPINFFEHCSFFFALSVENLININSPYWLKQKLLSVGILPVNNLLDYQNLSSKTLQVAKTSIFY